MYIKLKKVENTIYILYTYAYLYMYVYIYVYIYMYVYKNMYVCKLYVLYIPKSHLKTIRVFCKYFHL